MPTDDAAGRVAQLQAWRAQYAADPCWVGAWTWADLGLVLDALTAAEQRAAGLAALETAALAYRAWFIAYDGLEGNLLEGHRLLTALRQATAALVVPAGPPS